MRMCKIQAAKDGFQGTLGQTHGCEGILGWTQG